MNDELLHKWLNNTLTAKELEAFKQRDDFAFNAQLLMDAQAFKADQFSKPKAFSELDAALPDIQGKGQTSWVRPLLRYAAVLILGFTLYFSFFYNPDQLVQTAIAEQTTITLPDASTVILNADSNIAYNNKNWDNDRSLTLKGEAFFKVAKGSKFEVLTTTGTVSVLGTEFTVTQRDDYFNVACYEGKVQVTNNNNQVVLMPGDSYRILKGQVEQYVQNAAAPSWIKDQSTFSGVPLWVVLKELERQYGVTITTNQVSQDVLFNGAFTHKDINQALKQITLPLELTYSINNNTITISSLEP